MDKSVIIELLKKNVIYIMLKQNSKRVVFNTLFLLSLYKLSMSKRYSGKSFKDSSMSKKPKFTLKEKRRLKREKAKKTK